MRVPGTAWNLTFPDFSGYFSGSGKISSFRIFPDSSGFFLALFGPFFFVGFRIFPDPEMRQSLLGGCHSLETHQDDTMMALMFKLSPLTMNRTRPRRAEGTGRRKKEDGDGRDKDTGTKRQEGSIRFGLRWVGGQWKKSCGSAPSLTPPVPQALILPLAPARAPKSRLTPDPSSNPSRSNPSRSNSSPSSFLRVAAEHSAVTLATLTRRMRHLCRSSPWKSCAVSHL